MPLETYPTSLKYGTSVVMDGADLVEALVREGQIKVTYKPDGTPVTDVDLKVDEHVHACYQGGQGVEVHSEERKIEPVANPDLVAHLDPLDATANFAAAYAPWSELPQETRPRLPLSAAAISLGAVRPGESDPEWGVVCMPFLLDGRWLYTVKKGEKAIRTNAAGERQELALPSIDSSTRQVILLSERTASKFADQVRAAGFEVVVQDAGVANALSVFDPKLFDQCQSDVLQGRTVVGNIMRGHDWDVAAVLAIAKAVGGTATGLGGEARSLGQGERGALFAADGAVHSILRDIVRESAGR